MMGQQRPTSQTLLAETLRSWTPAERFVLMLARVQLEPQQCVALEAAARTFTAIVWRDVIQFAELHGLTSLVWFHIGFAGLAEVIPTATAADFRLKYQTRLLTQMRLAAALRDVLAVCQAQGISALVVKGPELGFRLYGFLGPRPSVDIDILFPQGIAQRTVYRIFAAHYQRWEAREVRVEFAWDLIRRPPFRASFPIAAIWQAAQAAHFDHQPCLRLGARDELRYLCTHFAMHHFARYIWLADIAELVRIANLDVTWNWPAFVAETVAAQVALPVLHSFRLAQAILDAKVPPAVMAALADAEHSPVEQRQWEALVESRLTLHKAMRWLLAAGAWREGLTTLRRLVWPDLAYLYDCHDWAPGTSAFAARRRRWQRMVARIIHAG